jgi:hypothetical protein
VRHDENVAGIDSKIASSAKATSQGQPATTRSTGYKWSAAAECCHWRDLWRAASGGALVVHPRLIEARLRACTRTPVKLPQGAGLTFSNELSSPRRRHSASTVEIQRSCLALTGGRQGRVGTCFSHGQRTPPEPGAAGRAIVGEPRHGRPRWTAGWREQRGRTAR